MKHAFQCPSCRFKFRVDEKFLGRKVRCPNPECAQPVLLDVAAILRESPAAGAPASSPVEPRRSPGREAVAEPATSAPQAARKTEQPRGNRPRQGHSESSDRAAVRNARTRKVLEATTRTSTAPAFLWLGAGAAMVALAFGGYWMWSSVGSGPQETAAKTDVPAELTAQTASVTASTDSEKNLARLAQPQLTSAPALSPKQQKDLERQKSVDTKIVPYMTKYCIECHGADAQEGGVAVHDLKSADELLKNRKKWERVYRMINAGAMPPSGHSPMPEEADREQVAEILYDELFNFDCNLIHHVGRSTLHRLNRAEYNNTVRDLFGISITPADKFPQDDVGEGFDNIGDVLSVPPLLMEKYLDAAEEVASVVIDTRDFSKGVHRQFPASDFTSSLGDASVNDDQFAVLATNGTLTVKFNAVANGKYAVRIEAGATQAGDEQAKMGLLIDGQQVKDFEVTGFRNAKWYEHTVELTQGEHSIAAAFLNDFYDPNAPERRRDRNLGVRFIEITGPEGVEGLELHHDIHRKFVTAKPTDTVSVRQAASQVLRPILYRAFRRPVTDAEVDRFAGLVERTVTDDKETYEYGLYLAVQAILVSPDFLFRKEADPEGNETERSLNEYEVASRLSYFLWSSMPDDQLFQLAENKRLLDREVLRGQIERMLHDDKAASLGRNFASQWLNLRNLVDVRPNPEVFPEFDDALRTAMAKETELLFATIVKEDRSIEEFLAADFTFVNERLAKHYGISGVQGEEFVRVSLQGSQRTGVLTHASILTLTSNPGRTSPVKRGKWILENILGEAPPPAPPGVPALEESTKDVTGLSLRERLELHRKDPGCASCHKTMDPLGMGLENFDATGRWRDKDSDKPVDASGDLPGGEKFSGPLELVSIIRNKREQFFRSFTERLMTYGLGRGLEYYDKCAVDHAIEVMKSRGNRFSAVVEGIVTSDPFLKRSKTREIETAEASK